MARLAAASLDLRAGASADATDQLAEVDTKLAALHRAKTHQVAQALKAGLDPALLEAAVAELHTEEAALLAHRARLTAEAEAAEEVADRAQRLRRLARVARERLSCMTAPERLEVIELLDVRVTVTGWESCAPCGATGKIKGGSGGLPRPSCHSMRRVPSLRITGVVSDGGVGELLTEVPHHPAVPGAPLKGPSMPLVIHPP